MAEVILKDIETIEVMSMSFTGPYEQAPERLHDLMAWLLRVGHPYSGAPVALFYDDPATVPAEELRGEICLPIAEDCEGFEGIVRRELPGGTMACLRVEGLVGDWTPLYAQVFQWIAENGMSMPEGEACREVYVRCPGVHDDPNVVIMEIHIPVAQPGDETEEAPQDAPEDAPEEAPEA
jgi:AraC family transcriptional regulator